MTEFDLSTEVQNQVVTAAVPLSGTPFSLRYRSDRTPGFTAITSQQFPVSGETVPDSLKRIELEVTVAGQRETKTFPPEPNQSYTFAWDGTDAYGRQLQGSRPYTARIGYVYDGIYNQPADRDQSFAEFAQARSDGVIESVEGSETREEVTLWTNETGTFDIWDNKPLGGGGWTVDVHHNYDPFGEVLTLGTGEQRTVIAETIRTIAGTGRPGNEPNITGKNAREVPIGNPTDIAIAPDGGFFISDWTGNRILRVAADGTITEVARVENPTDLTVGPSGALYFTQFFRGAPVSRVGQDGQVTTVAGGGEKSEDNIRATDAWLGGLVGTVESIDTAADGRLFIAETSGRLRQVGRDGIITTVAGDGDLTQDNIAATQHSVEPVDITVTKDGWIYLRGQLHDAGTFSERIFRILPQGIIETVVGGGTSPLAVDMQGTDVELPRRGSPKIDGSTLAVGPEDELYFVANPGGLTDSDQLFRLGTDGRIDLEAGTGKPVIESEIREGGSAIRTTLTTINGIDVDSSGRVVFADNRWAVRRVASPFPTYSKTGYVLASANGEVLYVFDERGRHQRTVDALTGALVFNFRYNKGRLAAIEDADGNVTEFQRAKDGTLTEVKAPRGQITKLRTDRNEYLHEVEAPSGKTARFEHTPSGLLTTVTDGKGNRTNFSYNGRGRMTAKGTPAGQSDFARSESNTGTEVRYLTPELRDATYRVEQLRTGVQRRINSCCGLEPVVTERERDGSQHVTYPDGTTVETVLSGDPRFGFEAPYVTEASVLTPSGRALNVSVTRSVTPEDLDDVSKMETLTDEVTVNERTYTREYDSSDRQFTHTTPMNRESLADLDERGRLSRLQTAGLAALSMEYNDRGDLARVTSGSGGTARTINVSYGEDGYPSKVTDPLGRTTQFTYDPDGRLTQQALPGGRTISLSYDDNGNLTGLTPPGRPEHTFEYTATDQVAAYRPPSVDGQPSVTNYRYNNDEQLTKVVHPGGETTDVKYDEAGRVSTVTIPRGRFQYRYDTTSGNLTAVTAPNGGKLAYEYDGPLLTATRWSGPVSGRVGFEYDQDFRVVADSVEGAQRIEYDYDADGLLVRAGELTLDRSPDNGLLRGSTIGGITDFWQYDEFGAPTQYAARYGGNSLYEARYDYDDLGRITRKTETVTGETTTYRYGYDEAGRLAEVRKNGSLEARYSYDVNGNRVETTQPVGTTTAEYDAQDRLRRYRDATYEYTPDGRLEKKRSDGGITTYEYDVLGNLLAVNLPDGTSVEYEVDGQNRRVVRKIDGRVTRKFLYGDQLNPIAELDANGNVRSRFVYGTRANVPDYVIRDGQRFRILSDHLGSPRLVVNVDTGAVAQRLEYDAWGNVLRDTNLGFQPFGFAGGVYNPETGLIRFGARDYDPEVGRWLRKDPLLFGGGDTNFFVYASSDPVNLIDPTGHETVAYGISAAWFATPYAKDNTPQIWQDWLATTGDEVSVHVVIDDKGNVGILKSVGKRYGFGVAAGVATNTQFNPQAETIHNLTGGYAATTMEVGPFSGGVSNSVLDNAPTFDPIHAHPWKPGLKQLWGGEVSGVGASAGLGIYNTSGESSLLYEFSIPKVLNEFFYKFKISEQDLAC